MQQRGRFVLGGVLAAAGLAVWAIVFSGIGPVGARPVGLMPDLVDPCCRAGAGEEVLQNLWAMEQRWAAQLLALGGLLILARGSTRAVVAAFAVVVGWLAADQVLDASGQHGWVAVGGTAAVVVVLMVAVGRRALYRGVRGYDGGLARRSAGSPPDDRVHGWLLVYAGVAIAAAPLANRAAPGRAASLALEFAAGAVGPLLAVSALVAALATRPRASVGRWLTVLVVAVAVAGTALLSWVQLRQPLTVGGPDGMTDAAFERLVAWWQLVSGAPVALTLAGAVAVTRELPRRWSARIGLAWLCLGVAVASYPVQFGAAMLASELPVSTDEFNSVNLRLVAQTTLPRLLGGLVLGLIAYAVARVPIRGTRGPAAGGQVHRGFAAAGAVLAGAGVAIWAVVLGLIEPAVRLLYDDWARTPSEHHDFPGGADGLASYAIWTKDLRWAAMVLATGGLLLLLRGSRWRAGLTGVAVPVWLAADFLLDRAGVSGWPAVAASGLGATALLGTTAGLGLRPRARSQRATGSALVLVYSGVAVCVAGLLHVPVQPSMTEFGPRLLAPVAAVIGPALVVAAVITALSAAPQPSAVRVVAALLFAGVGAAVAVWYEQFQVTPQLLVGARVERSDWTVAIVIGLVLAGCVLVAGGWGRSPSGWALAVGFVVLSPAIVLGLILGSVVIGYQAQHLVIPLTGDPDLSEGYLMVLAGVIMGGALGALMLLPRATAGNAAPPPPAAPPIVTPELSAALT